MTKIITLQTILTSNTTLEVYIGKYKKARIQQIIVTF